MTKDLESPLIRCAPRRRAPHRGASRGRGGPAPRRRVAQHRRPRGLRSGVTAAMDFFCAGRHANDQEAAARAAAKRTRTGGARGFRARAAAEPFRRQIRRLRRRRRRGRGRRRRRRAASSNPDPGTRRARSRRRLRPRRRGSATPRRRRPRWAASARTPAPPRPSPPTTPRRVPTLARPDISRPSAPPAPVITAPRVTQAFRARARRPVQARGAGARCARGGRRGGGARRRRPRLAALDGGVHEPSVEPVRRGQPARVPLGLARGGRPDEPPRRGRTVRGAHLRRAACAEARALTPNGCAAAALLLQENARGRRPRTAPCPSTRSTATCGGDASRTPVADPLVRAAVPRGCRARPGGSRRVGARRGCHRPAPTQERPRPARRENLKGP